MMAANDDIFGMLTADPAEMPSDKPAKAPKPAKTKETQKEAKTKEEKPVPDVGQKKFRYPFQLYMGSRLRDVTGLFEDGKEYSGAEITKIMIDADEYFFTGKIEYDYIEDTNTVVAMSIQHKKG